MGYELHALIGDAAEIASVAPAGATVIALAQGKALVPLTAAVLRALALPELSLIVADKAPPVLAMPAAIAELAARVTRLAYVEADFFGGDGTHATAVWQAGALVLGPLVADGAINQALRLLGVARGTHHDEFDALGLGRHRATDDWR